jgi:hypothetical protein
LKDQTFRDLSLYFRRLFQYGDLHEGQTPGSPTVLFRGSHSWEQRLHLYPFFLSLTMPMKLSYQIVIYCQGNIAADFS